jgi:hypothetical protein
MYGVFLVILVGDRVAQLLSQYCSSSNFYAERAPSKAPQVLTFCFIFLNVGGGLLKNALQSNRKVAVRRFN